MVEEGADEVDHVASLMSGRQAETFLCISRWAKQPITKRELSERVLADKRYDVPRARQTYSDHLSRLINLGLLALDPSDDQVVLITPLGKMVRRELIELSSNRVRRETTSEEYLVRNLTS